MRMIPFYTLELPESAKDEIREIYGKRQVSENIIEMFNKHLNYRMVRKRMLYDYEVITSKFYREEIKNPKINVPILLDRWMEIRVFNNGTTFRKKTKSKPGEAKHYRFRSEFIRKHGFEIVRKERPLKIDLSEDAYESSLVEKQTDSNLMKIEFNLPNLLSMTRSQIEDELCEASHDRFSRKTKEIGDEIHGIHKRFDFQLTYPLDDDQLYTAWGTKIGAYSMYNSMVNFKYGRRRARINSTNNRIDHRLLELPKECLRFVRVEGEGLVEFDLKNSQPCILMNILFGKLQVPYESFYTVLGYVNKDYLHLKSETLNMRSNIFQLIKASQNGMFYEVLQTLSQASVSRDEAKKATMFLLFSGFNSNWNPTIEIWKENHSTFYYFLQNLKRGYYGAYKDNELSETDKLCKAGEITAYQASLGFLPILLQKVESIIFIDNILNDIFAQNLFALSKHDSILCKELDMKKVELIMINNLNKLLGRDKYSLDCSRIYTNTKKKVA